ncbi:hypothetical protein E2562_021932 [Oryza meyeriana var. granulata]|uniref:Uncharacterized protein n=1 Tax=Oryza meyeriana var. granulata TaxID=110450 RepID=A0A6G1DLC9_9ORYZ|nr:hypothetical protein E2562_021932 [Oryza meyeriana var. granulata]
MANDPLDPRPVAPAPASASPPPLLHKRARGCRGLDSDTGGAPAGALLEQRSKRHGEKLKAAARSLRQPPS